MSGKNTSLKGVFGEIFGSGLKPSLFLPGLPVLSTKLITAQRALSCLVCLFFQPRARARARIPRLHQLARSLFLSSASSRSLRLSSSTSLSRFSCRLFFSRSLLLSLSPSRSLHNLAEWRALRRIRQVSFGLSAEEEHAPFRSSLLGGVAGRVLDNRSSPTEP